jgi:hypothetical protein
MTADRLSPEDVQKAWEASRVPEEYGSNYSHHICLVEIQAGERKLIGFIHDRCDNVCVPITVDSSLFGRTQIVMRNRKALDLGPDDPSLDRGSMIKSKLGLKNTPRGYGFVTENVRFTMYLRSPHNKENGFLLNLDSREELSPQDVAERVGNEVGFSIKPITPEQALKAE